MLLYWDGYVTVRLFSETDSDGGIAYCDIYIVRCLIWLEKCVFAKQTQAQRLTELLQAVLSVRFALRVIYRERLTCPGETQCLRVWLGYPVPGGYTRKYGGLALQVWGYVRESRGTTRTREWLRWRGPAPIITDRPVLSSDRASNINKPTTLWLIQIWSWAPDGYLTPR
jgi:hypothetical protein